MKKKTEFKCKKFKSHVAIVASIEEAETICDALELYVRTSYDDGCGDDDEIGVEIANKENMADEMSWKLGKELKRK